MNGLCALGLDGTVGVEKSIGHPPRPRRNLHIRSTFGIGIGTTNCAGPIYGVQIIQRAHVTGGTGSKLIGGGIRAEVVTSKASSPVFAITAVAIAVLPSVEIVPQVGAVLTQPFAALVEWPPGPCQEARWGPP